MIIKIKPIKGVKAFTNAIKNSRKFRSEKATAYVCFNENINFNGNYDGVKDIFFLSYGIILSKKLLKKAVVRNRIKRLIRESLRIITIEYNEQLKIIKTLVLSWNRNPMHPKLINLDEVKTEMRILINKILAHK